MQMIPVNSSAISSIGYDPETRVLKVLMRATSKPYDYPDVSREDADKFIHNPVGGSHGKHLAAHIKPKYGVKK